MKKIPTSWFSLLLLFITPVLHAQKPIDYVNPLIGTAASTTISAQLHGEGTELLANTFPAIGVPFGMAHFTPQTRDSERKCLSPYYYADSLLQGFRATRFLSGSCTQDFASVTLMATFDNPLCTPDKRACLFTHEQEQLSPAYYSVDLTPYHLRAEMTGLSRAGIFRFTFGKEGTGRIILQPNSDEGEGFVEVDVEKQEVRGYNPVHRIYAGSGKKAGFNGYFVARFSKKFTRPAVFKGEETLEGIPSVANDRQIGAVIGFEVKANEKIEVTLGLSYTSFEGARLNLEAEIPHFDFDRVRTQATAQWDKELSLVEVETSNRQHKQIFYTAVYHNLLVPRIYNDVDGKHPEFSTGRIIQTSGRDTYGEFSMWDIYRTTLPWHTIVHPTLCSSWASSFVDMYKAGGWLPIFPMWNCYTSAMIGDHAVSFLGDLIMKGIDGFDTQTAYEAMVKNAFQTPESTDREAYLDGRGRRALPSYMKYGYIPMEDPVKEAFHKGEQVSRTLEYAYDDFVLSQVARKLNKPEYTLLRERAQNYRNVFDPQTRWMRGRHADGTFVSPFDPSKKESFITEGTSRHYSWYVPQDIRGIMELMGGATPFVDRLKEMFDRDYYWHGNEPGQQIPFLFNYAGQPWFTQQYTRKILHQEYSTGPGGLCGNEDAGQMSAWYLMAAAGFYPVCPGTNEYVLGSPLFDKISFRLENGKRFTIETQNNSDENIYIQSATFNGTPYNLNFITHDQITSGGTLRLVMGKNPDMTWGREPGSRPFSLTQ